MANQSGAEDSEEEVMRIYGEMVEREQREKEKKEKALGDKAMKNQAINGSNGSRNGDECDSTSKTPKRKSKSVRDREDNTRKLLTKYRNVDKELFELREENQKLKKTIEYLKTQSKSVINKASEERRIERTSIMETIEVLKLNVYLISHLPDCERILDNYLKTNTKNVITSSRTTGPKSGRPAKKSSSPIINPISIYFKSVNKSIAENGVNGHNTSPDNDSDVTPVFEKVVNKSTNESWSSRLRVKIEPKSDNEDNQRETYGSTSRRVSPRKSRNASIETPGRRVSPRKANKRSLAKDSATESPSREQNESLVSNKSKASMGSESKDRNKNKDSDENPKPKRKRRVRREEEPKGHFPCTFDPRQCDEIMDTKEHFDFHMSGHYEAKYVCPFCAYTGPTIQIVKRHMNKEREAAIQDAKDGKYLNPDKRAHKDVKIYQCFGCKVCDKIHDKLEKRCEHIREDPENECEFMNDMDYEFKDHLKKHFADKLRNIKDSDERKNKIKSIVDKFVDEQYFENNAKKDILIEKFSETKRTERKDTEKPNEKQQKSKDDSSDSDWDSV